MMDPKLGGHDNRSDVEVGEVPLGAKVCCLP